MAHHLRHHCLARYRKRMKKSRRYRMRWGRKLFLPWPPKMIIRKIVKRSSQLVSSRFYVRGCRVVIDHPVTHTFRDDYTSPSLPRRYVFGGMPSSW